MSAIIAFPTGQGPSILVEVVDSLPGVSTAIPGSSHPDQHQPIEAGLADRIGQGVSQAQTTLREALAASVRETARALIDTAAQMQPAPEEIELTFGVKIAGETGAAVVAKTTSEANFTVRLMWSSKN